MLIIDMLLYTQSQTSEHNRAQHQKETDNHLVKDVSLVKKKILSQTHFCKNKHTNPLFQDESHNKTTFKH